ncbi:ROK family transcriptional regulator [Streptosporangium subroseum]|uniref:ROK family transcriptional regulator n=1 Tax=Streptosporangium subroseum TaxID=106412 RepID=UPI003421C38F
MEAEGSVWAVLRHLIDYGPLSRPDLGKGVGLARAATSAAVNDLMRRGLIGEIPVESTGRRGRPSYLLDMDEDRFAVIGMEIAPDRIMAGAYTLRGRQLLRVERPVEVERSNPRALLRTAAMSLYEVTGSIDEGGRRMLGAGVSVPGLVDAASGTVKYVPSLGWRDIALRTGVNEALGGRGPVLIGKDADFAALAERRARLRDGRAGSSLVYLTGTHGISAGIVTGDRLWQGNRGMAGEVGHVIIDPGGERCVCGRHGCFETRAGISAIVRTALAGRPARSGRAPTLAEATEEVMRLALAGDGTVVTVLAEAGSWLGQGAAIVSAILDPGAVVLGGHYARLAPWLLEPARKAFTAALLMPGDDPPELETCSLGGWAATEGAALGVLHGLASGDQSLPDEHPS